MEKTYTLKYIPTGLTFKLSKEDCDKYIKEDSDNFIVLDKDYLPPEDGSTSDIEQVILGEKPIDNDKKDNTTVISNMLNTLTRGNSTNDINS